MRGGRADNHGVVSRDSVETVRRAYEAWNQGDLDAVREIYAPDVTANAGALWPAGGEVTGPEAIIAAFASIREMFQRVELVAEEYIEHGEAVVVPTIWRGTLQDSETFIEQHVVAVYTFRGELVIHIDYCENLDEAFKRMGSAEREGVRR
jgi:ketosteroid isomerase-like protein